MIDPSKQRKEFDRHYVRSERLQVKVTPYYADKVKAKAEKLGTTVSNVIYDMYFSLLRKNDTLHYQALTRVDQPLSIDMHYRNDIILLPLRK